MKRKSLFLTLTVLLVVTLYLTGCGGGSGGTTTGGTTSPTTTPTAGNWTFTSVDENGFQAGDLKFNSSGNPVMTYSGGGADGTGYRPLIYAWYTGSNWSKTTVDQNVWTSPRSTIDFNSNGNPGIVYTDNYNYSTEGDGTVKYAWYDGANWQTEEVARGTGSSFEYDSSDVPWCVYYDRDSGNLIYAHRIGAGSWSKETVATNGEIDGYSSRFHFDSSGNPGILYQQGYAQSWALKYLHYNGSSWDAGTIESDKYIAGFDFAYSNGKPHVAYGIYTDTVGWIQGMYATMDSSSWSKSQFSDKVGGDPSIAVDSTGTPRIIAINGYQWTIYYTYSGGSWNAEEMIANGDGGAIAVVNLALKNDVPFAGLCKLSEGAVFGERN